MIYLHSVLKGLSGKAQPAITSGSREEWIKTADYLLSGIFDHVNNIEQPVVLPRHELEVSYPHKDSPEREYRAQRFEGLARFFLLASVRIRENPDITVSGIPLRQYYRSWILHACSPDYPLRAGRYSELMGTVKNRYAVFQQTVESGLLTIGLWACREQIWDTYSSDEKEVIVSFLKEYAYGNTVNQNWRLFNLLMLGFLEMCGYEQDWDYIKHLVTEVLLDYAGDGWYRDGQHIDYYSCWSYQVFLPLFNLWYGYEHLPETAGIIERYSNELIRNFSLFFDARGRMIMWGRSIIYRNAATVPLIGNLMLRHS